MDKKILSAFIIIQVLLIGSIMVFASGNNQTDTLENLSESCTGDCTECTGNCGDCVGECKEQGTCNQDCSSSCQKESSCIGTCQSNQRSYSGCSGSGACKQSTNQIQTCNTASTCSRIINN